MAHTKSIGNAATTKGQQKEHGSNKEGNLSARTDRYVHRYVHPVASGEVVCDPVHCHVATMAMTMTTTKYVKTQVPPRLL